MWCGVDGEKSEGTETRDAAGNIPAAPLPDRAGLGGDETWR